MKISENRKKIIKRLFKLTLVIIGIIIIVFNDTFGKLEGFAEFIGFQECGGIAGIGGFE